nr:hypothetical protein [Tanacetum cinerariifolium]
MRTFLRPRRWVVGPPLPAWLTAILRLLFPAALTPALARAATPFALTLLLLGALAIRPQAALAISTDAKSATVGIQNPTPYAIPAFSGTATILNNISGYRFTSIPAAASGIIQYPTATNGTGTAFSTAAANSVVTVQQAAKLVFVPATTGSTSPGSYRIVTLPGSGTLYVNGTAATANQVITLAQAAQLTYAAAAGYFGTTSFTYAPADAAGNALSYTTYVIPVTKASCGANNSVLDFSRRTVGEDWTNHASVAVNASNVTTGNYASSGTAANGNSFIIDNNTALPGPSLVWRQVNTGFDPATSPNTSTVTFTFDQPVTNLSLSIQDIDQNITATQAFTDALTLDGYTSAASTTPITLAATNFALGNTNTFSGNNTVTGTANSNVDPASNIVVT